MTERNSSSQGINADPERERESELLPGASTNEVESETRRMRIAIPLDNGCVATHFGHCPAFALYEVDEGKRTIHSKTTLEAPPHERGLLPRWLRERGANVVITGGMGRRAEDLFAQQGIRVVVGAPLEQADKIVASYLEDRLPAGVNLCDH